MARLGECESLSTVQALLQHQSVQIVDPFVSGFAMLIAGLECVCKNLHSLRVNVPCRMLHVLHVISCDQEEKVFGFVTDCKCVLYPSITALPSFCFSGKLFLSLSQCCCC